MNYFDLCRKNSFERQGYQDQPKRLDPQKMSAEIRGMVSSLEQLVELCRPRLIMGGMRHGSNWTHKGLMDYIQKKFDEYRRTGNLEMLVDVVNLCAVEAKLRTHPAFHYEPKDRKE